MRRADSVLVLGGVVALVFVLGFALVVGRSPGTATAGPAVDITGEWGYVYSVGGPPYVGGCTAELLQTGGTLANAVGGELECESAGTPSGTGGVISGTVSGLDLTWRIDFAGPGTPFYVNVIATISTDGDTQGGDWGFDPPLDIGTYLASRLAATCASPPCTDETVTFLGDTATVTFAEVTATGGTTVLSTETTTTGGILPASFQLAGTTWASDPFYTVLTTTEFTGNIDFCLSYQDKDNDGFVDGKAPPVPEGALRLLHNATGSFDPDTVNSIDTTNNVVCAVVSGLSEFALGAELSPTATATATPTATPTVTATRTSTATPPPPVGGISLDSELRALPLEEGDSSAGSTLPLAAVAAVIVATAVLSAAWYTRRRWLR